MKLFLSPFKPAVYLGGFLLLCIAMPLGRSITGDGGLWTIFGAFAVLLFFAAGGANWPAMNQLGTSFNRWMNSATLTALVLAAVTAPLTAASAVFHQSRSPYYMYYDQFLVTNGQPMPWTTSDGERYFLEGAAQDASSIAATVLLHVVVLLTAALTGIAIGLTRDTRRKWLMIGAFVAGGFVAGVARALIENPADPFQPVMYVVPITLAALIVLVACAIVFARTRRFVR